jgi:NTP pyrophosphatase (non-canonical NTP hydrolase)
MGMTLSAYQGLSRDTYRPIDCGGELAYPTLGLVNEAGEFAGAAKKIYRDSGGVISEEQRAALAGELGDVLWYLTQCASVLDLSLEDIAAGNLAKLQDRKARGVLGGSGDKR